MSQIPDDVAQFLAAHGLSPLEFEPGSTPTAEAAAARIGVPVPAWGTPFMPGGPNFAPERGPLGPNVVTAEAAAIEVPVFIANGEIDVCPDPLIEPSAYSKSPDITTMILPSASHMHNFASTREILWKRLENWASGIRVSWPAA